MRLTIDGHDTFVATGGKPFDPAKRAIVFLHGAGCDRTGWVLPARWFAHHGWSVLAPDLPGHGLSRGPALTTIGDMTGWVEQLLDAVAAPKSALVGHSMGGAIAIEAAARLGARITGLGLVGTAASIPVGSALLEAARKTPETAYDMMTAWALGGPAKRGGNPVPGLWMTGGVRRTFGANASSVLATDLAACAAWTSGPAAAGHIACPAVVITGALDVMTPARKGEELTKLIPGARLTRLTAVGHMVPHEAPDALLDALIAGLGAVAAAA